MQKRLHMGQSGGGLDNYYFSMYPNNQLIVYLFSKFLRIDRGFGVLDTGHGLMLIISFQCMLSTLAGFFVFKIIKEDTNTDGLAILGWMLFTVLVGFSGWNAITYTDAMALIFPIAVLRIYQITRNGKFLYFKWFLICSLSYWGYKMKPTVIIVLIAVVMAEGFQTLSRLKRGGIKHLIVIFLLLMICFAGYHPVFQTMTASTGMEIDSEADMGVMHVFMMGLNPVTHGGFYQPDVDYSCSYSDRKDRKEAQADMIKARMKDYGIVGFMKHAAKKILANFNDGSFAWGIEGGFYDVIFEEKNTIVSPLLRNIYYDGGKYHSVFLTVQQAVWQLVLFLVLVFSIFSRKRKDTAIVLALSGIFLFTLIFESRARYIYIYVPIFITAGMTGLCDFWRSPFGQKIKFYQRKNGMEGDHAKKNIRQRGKIS